MSEASFAVKVREEKGKGAARRLRQAGQCPGVVYGRGKDPVPVTVDPAKLERLLHESHAGKNTLIDLSGAGAGARTVIVKDMQREPVRGRLVHVDFQEIDEKKKIQVEVPVHLTGTPNGVTLGGLLDQQIREIEILCLPSSIPDEITVDISAMELGDSLHVSDLSVPEGVEVITDAELAVAAVLVPRGLKDGSEEGEGEQGAEASGEAEEKAESKED